MNVFRHPRSAGRPLAAILAVAAIFLPMPAAAQEPDGRETLTGTVASSTRNTVVVRGDNGRYHLFTFTRTTVKPATLQNGAQVRVTSAAGDDPGVRTATRITVLREASAAAQGAGDGDPVPDEVRRIERDIERQVRRFQGGVRAGVALDPELVLIGVQGQVGPFFNSDVYLRPNIEFAFGEVTALFGLNLEAIYRLPVTSRQARWSAYVGAGPGFNFLNQNFSRGNRNIDFDDFRSDTALNILGGIRYRNGMFLELKTTVYSDPAPTLRLIIGYNF